MAKQNEVFRVEGDQPEDEKSKKQLIRARLLAEARKEYSSFGDRYERTINAYYGTPDMEFTMKPGGWYIDLDNIRVNADPKFFLDKGFSESESLFATFHEAEHFRDMILDPDAYTDLFDRLNTRVDVHTRYPGAVKRLYNCLDDILVNRSVMSRWKAGRTAKNQLYPKLFPESDLRGEPGQPVPRHRQLMYALLRQYMLPHEPVQVDDEVREALDSIENRGAGKHKFVDLFTSVDAMGKANYDAITRFSQIQARIEPVFEALYKKDLIDRKPKPKDKGEGEGEAGEGEGEPFGDDEFEDAIPDPMDIEDVADAARKINDAISKKRNDAFKNAMGVEQKDFDAYKKDFDKVKPYIEDLSKTFDEIIERRKSYRRRLRKPVKEGVMLDPKKVATGVAEIRAGNFEPRIMLDFEAKEVINNMPTEIEFTLVCDGSGSMTGGVKEAIQRRLAVLAMEALAVFRDRIQKERRRGENVELDIKTEVRVFSDTDLELKKLDRTLDHEQRVKMHKGLHALPGGGNNEPATFQELDQKQMVPERLAKLADGRLKKIILFLTDGQTNADAIQAEIKKMMAKAGKDKHGNTHLVIAGIGFDNGKEAIETYAPNGFFVEKLEDVLGIFKEFLKNILADV